ncbi:MAG: hypothetical protein K2X82_01660 [Gemmataceae bacterium]|nr:hypothetical protein [Gemmataceae bacterium]
MDVTSRFPWWVPAGGLLLAALYLPTLATPFDFVDDGNLVYPSTTTGLAGHAGLWWDKVRANYDHLGPFRPTLWAHWQLQANLFDGDPLAWRAYRLAWCALAATVLLWLFRELGVHPAAALFAGALAMWNPYRNEVWTSLTLAEGVAMPYALFGLVAARKAATSPHPLRWELASAFAVFVALGCKNTFAALVPAQVLLRMWPDGVSLRKAWRQNGLRSLLLGLTLLMPAAHFVYFKAHWHPGQYETPGLSFAQAGRVLNALKGAVSLEFLAAGVVLAVVAVRATRQLSPPIVIGGLTGVRTGTACALLLILAGVAVYLPMGMMSGRYAMPAVWGLDILFALLLSALVAAPLTVWKKAAWVGVAAGLAAVAVTSVGKQEKFAARAKMLWEAVHHVEATAPPGARVAWVAGDGLKGGLNIEEGIHFQWHLYHRGRGDVRVALYGDAGRPLERTELPPPDGPPDLALYGTPGPAGWEEERTFAAAYWLGRKRYDCHLGRKRLAPAFAGRDEFRRLLLGLERPDDPVADGRVDEQLRLRILANYWELGPEPRGPAECLTLTRAFWAGHRRRLLYPNGE